MTDASPPKLSFWFDFASTYSYLTAMRIDAMAQARGVEVVWRPFLLGPIFVAQGWTSSPFNIYPLKGAYMWRDIERQAQALDLPVALPDPFPQNSLTAARLAMAALEEDPTQRGPAFCRALFQAEFGDGRDISQPATLAWALEKAGFEPAMAERTQDPAIKQKLKDAGVEAAELKIFGAPSLTVGTELFWGDDRLNQALDWAVSGRISGSTSC